MSKSAKIIDLPAKKSSLTEISKPCFAAMQSQTSLALTMPYHAEELAHIERVLRDVDLSGGEIDCFIAIGCANLRYADVAFQHCWNYAAIEPSLAAEPANRDSEILRRLHGIRIIPKNFEDVEKEDLPRGRKLFFFLFNVFPYINDAEKKLRELANPDDLVVVSSWNNDSTEARILKESYYSYLSSQFNCTIADKIDPDFVDKLLTRLPDAASNAYRVKQDMTDIVTYRVKKPAPGIK